MEEYQANFPDSITGICAGPIRNFITCRISGETPGAIIAFNYPGRATDYDADVLQQSGGGDRFACYPFQRGAETEQAFIYTIEALARACEAAEEQTGRHIQRVNRYAGALAANMRLSAEFVELLSYSAQMHDVGKIKVPAAILLKEGQLTGEELRIVKLHPGIRRADTGRFSAVGSCPGNCLGTP